MILWLALFLLIVVISFVLAMQSMKDYQEIPQKPKEDYGLFLIRRIDAFSPQVLGSILKHVMAKGLLISIERLFKGHETALTLFGPKEVLDEFISELSLLELEDYAQGLDSKDVSVWELGAKDMSKFNTDSLHNIFGSLPRLDTEDQFFWQVVLGKNQSQIRALFHSKDADKRKKLAPLFHDLKMGELVKVPRPFSHEQMMNFYQLRSLSKDSKGPVLDPESIIKLLRVV